MCEPVSATMAVLAIAGTAATMYANKEATEYQAQETGSAVQRNNDAALEAYKLDTQQLGLAATQESEALASEELHLKLETRKAASTARAANAESGLAGYSLDAQVDDIINQGFSNITTLDANREHSLASRDLQRDSIQLAAKNRQQGFNPYQSKASTYYTGAALQIANAGVNGYTAGKQL